MELMDFVIKLSAFVAAVLALWGIIYGIVKWFQKQNKQTADIKSLEELHKKDMEAARKKEAEDMQDIKDELCVLSYAVLATLDGLQQLHCNGNVTRAHDRLEKHLNQRAHGQ